MVRGFKQLLAERGDSEELRAASAESEYYTATLFALLGENDDAEAGYRRAIEQYEKLAAEFKGEVRYRAELARCNFDLAFLLNDQGRRPEAEAAYRRAIELHEKLSADFPDEPAYRRELADDYINLGALLRDRQKLAEAEKAFREAVTLGEKVADEVPDFLQYRINLAASYHDLGNAVRDRGDARSSLDWYGKAIELLDPINPRPDDATTFLRNAHWDRANALGQLGKHAEAVKDWRRALDLEAAGPDRPHLQAFLNAAQIEVKLQAQAKPAAELLYEVATAHARATGAAKAAGEDRLQEDQGQRALELLRQAREAGLFADPQWVKRVKANKVFSDSLPPDDFRRFLESLEPARGPKDGADKK
jgi:tetratricopeptide (TPR) repeat protein